jgi:hypothetical protein
MNVTNVFRDTIVNYHGGKEDFKPFSYNDFVLNFYFKFPYGFNKKKHAIFNISRLFDVCGLVG